MTSILDFNQQDTNTASSPTPPAVYTVYVHQPYSNSICHCEEQIAQLRTEVGKLNQQKDHSEQEKQRLEFLIAEQKKREQELEALNLKYRAEIAEDNRKKKIAQACAAKNRDRNLKKIDRLAGDVTQKTQQIKDVEAKRRDASIKLRFANWARSVSRIDHEKKIKHQAQANQDIERKMFEKKHQSNDWREEVLETKSHNNNLEKQVSILASENKRLITQNHNLQTQNQDVLKQLEVLKLEYAAFVRSTNSTEALQEMLLNVAKTKDKIESRYREHLDRLHAVHNIWVKDKYAFLLRSIYVQKQAQTECAVSSQIEKERLLSSQKHIELERLVLSQTQTHEHYVAPLKLLKTLMSKHENFDAHKVFCAIDIECEKIQAYLATVTKEEKTKKKIIESVKEMQKPYAYLRDCLTNPAVQAKIAPEKIEACTITSKKGLFVLNLLMSMIKKDDSLRSVFEFFLKLLAQAKDSSENLDMFICKSQKIVFEKYEELLQKEIIKYRVLRIKAKTKAALEQTDLLQHLQNLENFLAAPDYFETLNQGLLFDFIKTAHDFYKTSEPHCIEMIFNLFENTLFKLGTSGIERFIQAVDVNIMSQFIENDIELFFIEPEQFIAKLGDPTVMFKRRCEFLIKMWHYQKRDNWSYDIINSCRVAIKMLKEHERMNHSYEIVTTKIINQLMKKLNRIVPIPVD